jgi:hypothetical protein
MELQSLLMPSEKNVARGGTTAHGGRGDGAQEQDEQGARAKGTGGPDHT